MFLSGHVTLSKSRDLALSCEITATREQHFRISCVDQVIRRRQLLSGYINCLRSATIDFCTLLGGAVSRGGGGGDIDF